MGIKRSAGKDKKALKKIYNINIINRYKESERVFDGIYISVTNLEYGALTVLTKT
jgi:hypothetical protein